MKIGNLQLVLVEQTCSTTVRQSDTGCECKGFEPTEVLNLAVDQHYMYFLPDPQLPFQLHSKFSYMSGESYAEICPEMKINLLQPWPSGLSKFKISLHTAIDLRSHQVQTYNIIISCCVVSKYVRCIWSMCMFDKMRCIFAQLHKPNANPHRNPNPRSNSNPNASALCD